MSKETMEYLHMSELFTLQVYLSSTFTNVKFPLWAAQFCLHINAQWSSFAICVFFNSLASSKWKHGLRTVTIRILMNQPGIPEHPVLGAIEVTLLYSNRNGNFRWSYFILLKEAIPKITNKGIQEHSLEAEARAPIRNSTIFTGWWDNHPSQ